MTCRSIETFVEKLTEEFSNNMDEHFEWDGSLEKDITGYSIDDLVSIVDCLHRALETTLLNNSTHLIDITSFQSKTLYFNATTLCRDIKAVRNNLTLDELIDIYFAVNDIDIM